MNPFLPVTELVLNSGLSLFSKVSVVMTGLVATLVLMRIVFLQLRFANVYEYGGLLKDLISYFGIVALFPYLVKMIFGVAGSIALKVAFLPAPDAQATVQEFFSSLFFHYEYLSVISKLNDLIVINLAQAIYSVFSALLLSIAPICIFLSTILGIERGLGTYFMTLISISLWPVLWNLIGLLGKELFNQQGSSTLMTISYWFIIQVLQLTSPLFCGVLFKSLSSSGAVTKVIGLGTTIRMASKL